MTGDLSRFGAPAAFALIGATLAPVFFAPPAAAGAMDSNLQLSSDGVNYGRSLFGPVFGPITGYVPGSTSSADIWVRNNDNGSAFLSVAALVLESDAAMATNLGLRIESSLGSAARTPLSGPGSCSDLAVGWAVAAGESVRLTLTLDLDANAPNATRRKNTELAFRFVLEDQDGSTRRGACASSAGGTLIVGLPGSSSDPPASAPYGSLADTGTPDPFPWIAGALAALASGSGIVAFMKRKKAGRNDED
jgi:hypothetical protein